MIKISLVILFVCSLGRLAFTQANAVHDFKVLEQADDSVLFELSYNYDGDHGDKAVLTAWPLPAGYWGSAIIPLVKGERKSQIKVWLMPKIKEAKSDTIQFFYYSDGGPPFYQKTFNFKKVWKKSLKSVKK